MTPETVLSAIESSEKKDERRRIIIALLFLLLGFSCIFCSSQSALWLIDRSRIYASMLSGHRADYGAGPEIVLAPLSGDIAAEANQDEEQLLLKQTPIAGGLGVVILPNPIPTPMPTVAVLLPTPTPTLTPTVSSPPAPATPTAIAIAPTPTSVPPTSPPATSPPPASPPATSPLPTSPLPTSPLPTSLPPTSPPSTSAPPTATFTPTATPVPPTVFFAAASFSINENGGVASITVNLSAASALTVTVNYATSPGTATAGSDYTATGGVLSFSPGVTSQTFPVAVLDDLFDELDETVNLTLSAPTNATLGAPNPALLTIVDDDPSPTVQFTSAGYSAGEGAGPASMTVILSAASALTVTVNYASSDGTATAGSDYTATGGTLTFAPGSTSQTFPVAILDDLLDEPDETVNLTLSAPTFATLGAPNPAILTIVDDDAAPTVQFSAPNYNVNENDGVAPITVTLSTALALTVAVDYATSNGIPPNAALAGSDYISTSGTLTFAPLQTSQSFTVTIIDDAGEELDETLDLTLINPVNAMITGTNPAMLTIADNDPGSGPCVNPLPPPPTVINIGPPDCRYTFLGNNVITISLPSPISVTGDPNPADYELVYYERESDPGSTGIIAMDMVQVAVSTDTITWYPVFDWGDGVLDANTNIGQAPPPGPYGDSIPPGEIDNAPIPMSVPPLYQSSGGGPITGIAIDVDNPASPFLPPPPGSYPYVRLSGGGTAEVDSIEVLP